MGSADDYCAICGGPLRGDLIAEKPRTAAFLKKWAKDKEQHLSGNQGAHGPRCEVDEYELEDWAEENKSWNHYDEDNSYDEDVISVKDAQWTQTIHVLGLNPNAEGHNKVFVSGPGTYVDVGGVDVDNGDDPNAEDFDIFSVRCYQNENDNRDAIFPFHWCCYEMLSKCVTGSFDARRFDGDELVYRLNNNLLYGIMQELLDQCGRSFSDIDYGDARRMQDQFWEAKPGYEFLVCHPSDAPGAKEVVLSMFASGAFKARSRCSDLGSRVRSDPFLRIPYDVVYRISGFISNEDLVNLARASWPVHGVWQNNDQFWRQRIRATFLPWFFELAELVEQDEKLLRTNNPQLVFQWAERSTRPDRWLTGPLMGVVNRRRIWRSCEQYGRLYRAEEEFQNDASISDEERLIRKYSKDVGLAYVSSPGAIKVNPTRTVFWAKTWTELRSQEKTLESFWDRRGSLVGISLTPNGQERRLLGISGSDDEMTRTSMRFGAEEWIKGLVLHLPVPTDLDDDGLETSLKGITVILDSGRRSVMGDTSGCHMQRLLSVAPDWCITGMRGTTGFVRDNLQLTRLGLVEAQPPGLGDYSVPPHRLLGPRQTQLEQLSWDDDYSQVLGQSIQEHQTLELTLPREWYYPSTGYSPNSLLPHGALIWAKDAGEQRALRRFKGCIVSGRGFTGPAHLCVSGISAEHEPAADPGRREVVVNKAVGLFESFDMDGPGGEVVTEIEVPKEDFPRALKIHTSLGRTCSWGEAGTVSFSGERIKDWRSIKAPTGKTLVGLVVSFGRRRDVIEFVGGLSMPLEAFDVLQTTSAV